MPWRAIAEMLGCSDDPTVLERQQARLMWQHQQCLSAATTTTAAYHDLELPFSFATPSQNSTTGSELGDEMPSPVFGGTCPFSGSPDMSGLSRTFSCPPVVRVDDFKQNSNASKKRMAEDNRYTEIKEQFDCNADKKTKCHPDVATQLKPKREIEPSSGANEKKNNEISVDNSKGSTKVAEAVPKTDYIHVRARRGQATDSHSLAERVRREKISERMKYLQDLVPGCNRITGKAGMLDEIINYVQSLQRQVEFLSMKLTTVNPAMEFNPDTVLTTKSIPACNTGLHTAMGISNPHMDGSYVPAGSFVHPCASSRCEPEMPMNPSVPALSRTMSAPVSFPADVFAATCFDSLGAASAWDQSDLLCLNNGVQFHHGKKFFAGVLGGNSIKMEM